MLQLRPLAGSVAGALAVVATVLPLVGPVTSLV